MIPVKRYFLASFLLAATLGTTSTPAQAPAPAGTQSNLFGDWRGDSVCVVREGACRDEKALYHVAEVPGKPDLLAITFSKVMDDRTINMGTLECPYDQGKSTATCEYPTGIWVLQFKDKEMNGTLTLANKTLLRRVNLKKGK